MTHYIVEYQCPQCGAPADLEENSRMFVCQYCRVKSYLLSKNYFSYVMKDNAPENKDMIYVPYWRMKGMLFSSLMDRVDFRVVDISQVAISSSRFPFSLGVRSQTQKLRFVTAKTPGRFLSCQISMKKAMDGFKLRHRNTMVETPMDQAYVGETLSLIYAPFYKDGDIYDAILNQPIAGLSQWEPENRAMGSQVKLAQPIRFVPALCPHCGWDLKGAHDSLVLTCTNCHTLSKQTANGLELLPFGQVKSHDASPAIYMPFWRVRSGFTGLILNNYGQLARFANVPKVLSAELENRPCYFWIPAFKLAPKRFLRVAAHLTMNPPEATVDIGSRLPDAPLYPINLPVREAVNLLKPILADIVKPRRKFLPRLPQISAGSKRFLLVYLPFSETAHEYVFSPAQLAVNKNRLKMATML